MSDCPACRRTGVNVREGRRFSEEKVMEPAGIYIHIPFCVKKCNYCDFPSYSGLEGIFHNYAQAVCTEMERAARQYGRLCADTVFIGGGTPSLLPAEEISLILDGLYRSFMVSRDAEITLEANPGTVSRDKAGVWKDLGINRISIGLQAAQDRLLQSMGRIHSREMFLESVDLLKEYGFDNINADIIFGVPGQTMADWIETTELVLASGVCHISAYSLQIEEGTVWFQLHEAGKLPEADEELEREMYHWIIARLNKAGFRHYEISNFARPGFECRHNLKYWTGRPYLGIGSAAHSLIGKERLANTEHPVEYIRQIRENVSHRACCEILGPKEELSERFFLGLRLIDGVSLPGLQAEFGQEAVGIYGDTIRRLESKGLVTVDGDMLRLTRRGLDYANQVWMEFV